MKRREKGEGTIRKRSDGRWEGRYVDSTGVARCVYEKSKSKLREKLNELMYLRNSTCFDNIGGDISLDIYFQHYISIKETMLKHSSIEQINLAYNKHIKDVMGNKILCKININDILMLKKSLQEKKLAEVTQNIVFTHLKTILNFASKEGILMKNPFLYIRNKTPKQKKQKRDLTNTEIQYILDEAKNVKYKADNFYIILSTLIYTGMRAGEVCGLKWNDIDNEFRHIKIDESLSNDYVEDTPKSENSCRTIPLNEFLSKLYRNFWKGQNPSDINDFIFKTARKNPYTPTFIGKRLKLITERIKEKHGIDLTFVSPHYFRHTFATQGINNGVSLKNMQMLMGHANTRTLTDVYLHTNNRESEKSIDVIWNAINIK